jgi:hypothetical protein
VIALADRFCSENRVGMLALLSLLPHDPMSLPTAGGGLEIAFYVIGMPIATVNAWEWCE